MGFSVSGSFAIIVVAAFMAFGMAYSAGTDGYENVRGASKSVGEGELTRQNTAIEITQADYTLDVSLTIEATNNGTSVLSVNETDLLVDNQYVTHQEIEDGLGSSETVDGDGSTDLWQPGETLTITLSQSILDAILTDGDPQRVKIITGPGVADSRGVS